MKMKLFTYSILIIFFIFSSCVRTNERIVEDPAKIELQKRHKNRILKFPKIKKYRVSLELISPQRTFFTGEKNEITWRLKNLHSKSLVIYEWMKKQSNNIQIYYTPYLEKSKIPNIENWNSIKANIGKKPVQRYTLELSYRSSVLIKSKLAFIEKMDSRTLPIKGQKYIIIGKLNLNSISARSKAEIITVRKGISFK